MNLISNAIKFSHKDSAIITRVNVEDIQNENVKIMISVEDQGIGINEQDQKNLFKPYFVTTDKISKQIN